MKRIQLYELAVATGKSLVVESDPIKLQLAIANEAVANKVDSADFATFQQDVNNARQLYNRMASSKLPSEMAAERAANKTPAPVSNATAQTQPAAAA